MASIDASTSGAGGVITTADNTGILQLKSAGTTVSTINAYGIGLGTGVPSSGIGITFPATQSASTDANTLDDYEEGTWTPVVAGGSTAGAGTYSSQEGTYTKIGNMVIVNCFISWSAHTGTGSFTVTGLPFASNGSYTVQCGSIYASDFNAGTNATQLIPYPNAGTTTIIFRGFVNNATRTVPDIDTAAVIAITLTYRV